MNSKKYELLLGRLALKYNKPISVIRKLVESQFEFIQTKTKEIDFNSIDSEEEFKEMKTNFNVKYLFTLAAYYKGIEKIKEHKLKRNETQSTSS